MSYQDRLTSRLRVVSETPNLVPALIVVGALGIGGYFVYKIANPSVPGGSCSTVGSPCYTAVQPYQEQFQSCLNSYTQLNTQIAQSGQAPTAAQIATLANYTQCMNDAAASIASVAKGYEPQSNITQIISGIVEVAFAAAVLRYGLPALGTFIANLRASGGIRTALQDGSSVSSVITNGTTQLARSLNLLDNTEIDAWEAAVNAISDNSVTDVEALYATLAEEDVISQAVASAEIAALTSSIDADASATIEALIAG